MSVRKPSAFATSGENAGSCLPENCESCAHVQNNSIPLNVTLVGRGIKRSTFSAHKASSGPGLCSIFRSPHHKQPWVLAMHDAAGSDESETRIRVERHKRLFAQQCSAANALTRGDNVHILAHHQAADATATVPSIDHHLRVL